MAGGGGGGGHGEGAVIGDAVNNTDVVRTMIAINVPPLTPRPPPTPLPGSSGTINFQLNAP